MPERYCDQPIGTGQLTELRHSSEVTPSNSGFSLIPDKHGHSFPKQKSRDINSVLV